MAADTDIANIALSHLGDDSNIASLNENSPQAAACNQFYPIARDAVLERAGFSFCLRRISLAQDLVVIPTSWQFGYAAPSNCLRKIAVLPPNALDDMLSAPYAVESISDTGEEIIYTNVQQATLRYVQRVTDTTKFPPLVVMAIARLLAAFLAGKLIKGTTGMNVAEAQLKIFENVEYLQATASNANGQQTDHFADFMSLAQRARHSSPATPLWPGPLASFP